MKDKLIMALVEYHDDDECITVSIPAICEGMEVTLQNDRGQESKVEVTAGKAVFDRRAMILANHYDFLVPPFGYRCEINFFAPSGKRGLRLYLERAE